MLHLISCNDLYTDDEDVSDPFVQITCGKSAMKSKRMNNNLNPEFNETFRIPWDTHCPIVLEVMDYDGSNETQPLGDLTIDVEALDFSDGNVIKFKNKKLQNRTKQKQMHWNQKKKRLKSAMATFADIPCCLCGVPIQPNPANMCATCLNAEVDF